VGTSLLLQVLLVPARILWVLLPAYVANAAATFPRGRGPPMDFGRHLARDGERILGPSKTWSGFVVGSLFPLWVGLLQEYLILIAPPDLQIVPAFASSLWGAVPVVLLLTVGALTGDAIGSFVKRRRRVPPGGRSIVLDQLLFVIVPVGIGLVVFPAVFVPTFVSVAAVLWTVALTVGLHVGFNYVGYWWGLKKVPW
jgi:CDP-2,3-bis-(O-geranylgeranyl)-sn-glycerol synthase